MITAIIIIYVVGIVSIVTKDIFTSTDRRFPYRSVRVIFKEA